MLPYKNVDAIIEAVNGIPDVRLVVVGIGPDRERLHRWPAPACTLVGRVEDDELRWLYRNCSALVAASYEDYGLSPLEAGAFGRPTVVLRDGGFLDTVVEGSTGVFFDTPTSRAIVDGIQDVLADPWNSPRHHSTTSTGSRRYRFVRRLHEVVAQFSGSEVVIPTQRRAGRSPGWPAGRLAVRIARAGRAPPASPRPGPPRSGYCRPAVPSPRLGRGRCAAHGVREARQWRP